MRLVSTLVLASGLLSGTFAVPGMADNAPAEKTGLKVGTKAPAFTLKDQSGTERSLNDFLKKGTLAVVFYRSASWSPFCQKQLVQLQADLKEIEAAGCHLAGVSYDSVDSLARFAEKEKITFPLLADPGSKTITAYGLLNTEAKGKAEGTPYPVTMLIDREGVIRAKLFLDGYRDRHSKELLVKAVAAIKDDAVKKEWKTLQGNWTVISIEVNGTKVPEDKIGGRDAVFKDGRYAIHDFQLSVKIDPNKKPKTIDMDGKDGNGKPLSMIGIYDLDGDALKICFAKPGTKERPAQFETRPNTGESLIIYRRSPQKQ